MATSSAIVRLLQEKAAGLFRPDVAAEVSQAVGRDAAAQTQPLGGPGAVAESIGTFWAGDRLYARLKSGRFEGRLSVIWNGLDEFIYEPDPTPGRTFAFVRWDGTRIAPRLMETDGGSIPGWAQINSKLSPWGYAPAYIIHDWLFTAHKCGYAPDNNWSFEDTAEILAEAIKTLMEVGYSDHSGAVRRLEKAEDTLYLIYRAILTSFARQVWNDTASANCLLNRGLIGGALDLLQPAPAAPAAAAPAVRYGTGASTAAAAPATPARVTGAMDFRLQRLADRRNRGLRTRAGASAGSDEVAVVAKVSDVPAWEALSEVRVGARLGPADDAGASVVTARIPLARLEYVRTRPFVISLKAPQRVHRALAATTKEIGARPADLPDGNPAQGGGGAIVGIVDFGMDFAHRNFLKADKTTRLLEIWDQGAPGGQGPFGYGRIHNAAAINAALKKPDPYSALGYLPDPGAHGTHVCDIAAGGGGGSGVPGVAPEADIVFVQLAASDVPWSGPEVVGKSFGDSTQLLEAVAHIFEVAKTAGRPCVVNLSLGTNGGPHDGTTLVEEGLDRLVAAEPGRAVVLAASNSYGDGIHAAGRVPQGGHLDLDWNVPASPANQTELELWYAGGDRFTAEIFGPDGQSLGTVAPGGNLSLTDAAGNVVVFAANRLTDPNNRRNVIGLFVENGAPGGTWRLRLHGDSAADGTFHAWLERNDAAQASFPEPHDNSHTVGSVSCGKNSIAVGSYDAHKASLPLSWFSSAGPTVDGRPKPEISAPGHAVVAANSRSTDGTGTTTMSGTSMAAPAVTGVVALMLAAARNRGITLTIGQIRDILKATARRNPPPGTAWDPRYGNGRVSAFGAVNAVMALPAPAAAVIVTPAPAGAAARASRSPRRKKAAKAD